MSVRLSVVTPMSQIQHSGGQVSSVRVTAKKLPKSQAIWRRKIGWYWIVNGRGYWTKRSCYSLCYCCNIFVQEMKKPRKTEVKFVGVPAEFLNGQPPNTRQGVAAWDNLPPHSRIRDLVLDSYKHANRKFRKLRRMPLGILRSMLYGACKTLSNLLALIKINQEAEH